MTVAVSKGALQSVDPGLRCQQLVVQAPKLGLKGNTFGDPGSLTTPPCSDLLAQDLLLGIGLQPGYKKSAHRSQHKNQQPGRTESHGP